MAEWWTYSLSDFLLFSPQTYYRLFELYNAAIWPAQLVALALGVFILVLLRFPAPAEGRLIAAALALCWIWVAAAFHLERYATINWAAEYFAAVFAMQAALLLGTAVVGSPRFKVDSGILSRAGLGLFVFALLVQPLVGLLAGRDWREVELFGVAPDPTAVATLGVVSLAAGRTRWELLVLPLLWCAVSGATLFAMGSPEAWLLFAAAGLGGALALRKTRTTAS